MSEMKVKSKNKTTSAFQWLGQDSNEFPKWMTSLLSHISPQTGNLVFNDGNVCRPSQYVVKINKGITIVTEEEFNEEFEVVDD